MASRQTWPLSQTANKTSGVCSVCHAVRQLHLKDGTVHRHGHRLNPCPGSDKPPLPHQSSTPVQAAATALSPPAATATADNTADNTATVVASSLSTRSAPAVAIKHPQDVGVLIKHIPKSARPACATFLTSLITKVNTNTDDLDAWSSLFHFGSHILQKPARTGSRHNLVSIIKKRMDESAPKEQRPVNITAGRKKRDANELLAAAVTAKVEDGNIRAAIRILCSDEKPATDTDATYAKLLERHPAPPSNRIPVADPADVDAIQVSEREVMQAIRSFPAGSSGGPDGVRPQHALDLVSCRETGPALLSAITGLVNALLNGKCNPAVTPIIFGGQLMALEKSPAEFARLPSATLGDGSPPNAPTHTPRQS